MIRINQVGRLATWGISLVAVCSVAACGGNVGGGGSDAADFPDGPITLLIGQDPGGSTDLIGRSLAELVSEELGVPVSVENVPGANGTIAAQELAGEAPDGQTLMVINGSLAYITPLAVSEDEAVAIDDYAVITGISQDDYVLITAADSGFATVEDLAGADGPVTYGTTGVGTGSQLSQELLFAQSDIEATAVPFDGGSPTLTAVLGGQVDVGSVQLGEAISQIEAGELTPIVTFAEERPSFLPDTPTAVEAGYEVPVQQSRAIVAPEGTPEEIVDTLQAAFETAFESESYQDFNEQNLLTPNEVDGDELIEQWNGSLDSYRAVVEEFGISLGENG